MNRCMDFQRKLRATGQHAPLLLSIIFGVILHPRLNIIVLLLQASSNYYDIQFLVHPMCISGVSQKWKMKNAPLVCMTPKLTHRRYALDVADFRMPPQSTFRNLLAWYTDWFSQWKWYYSIKFNFIYIFAQNAGCEIGLPSGSMLLQRQWNIGASGIEIHSSWICVLTGQCHKVLAACNYYCLC